MDDKRDGAALRAIRIRCRLTQDEVSIAASVPRSVVRQVERGHLGDVRLGALRAIASALDARLDVAVRWQGGDLGRLLNARHSAMHEALAARFGTLSGWALEPEVSFSVYGERGVIDGLAWHGPSRSLLVIELKTELVDVNELMGSVDRKRRLAPDIGRERGWRAANISTWVAVADSRTNRRELARHANALRLKFPADGHAIGAWLRRPSGSIQTLGFMPIAFDASSGVAVAGVRRVRRGRQADPGA